MFDLYLIPSKKKVSAASIGNIVRAQNLCPTEKQLQAEISKAGLDPNGGAFATFLKIYLLGEAELPQVVQIVNTLQKSTDANISDALRAALQAFDHDGADFVGITELSHVS